MDIAIVQNRHKAMIDQKGELEERLQGIGRQIDELRNQQMQTVANLNAVRGAIQILEELMAMEKEELPGGGGRGKGFIPGPLSGEQVAVRE